MVVGALDCGLDTRHHCWRAPTSVASLDSRERGSVHGSWVRGEALLCPFGYSGRIEFASDCSLWIPPCRCCQAITLHSRKVGKEIEIGTGRKCVQIHEIISKKKKKGVCIASYVLLVPNNPYCIPPYTPCMWQHHFDTRHEHLHVPTFTFLFFFFKAQ